MCLKKMFLSLIIGILLVFHATSLYSLAPQTLFATEVKISFLNMPFVFLNGSKTPETPKKSIGSIKLIHKPDEDYKKELIIKLKRSGCPLIIGDFCENFKCEENDAVGEVQSMIRKFGIVTKGGVRKRRKYFHSYISVSHNKRGDDHKDLENNRQAVITLSYNSEKGIEFEIMKANESCKKRVYDMFLKIKQELEYRLPDEIKTLFQENNNIKVKISDKDKGPEGLGMIDVKNKNTFFLHGSLFFEEYSEDMSEAITLIMIIELLRLKRGLLSNVSVKGNQSALADLAKLYNDLLGLYNDNKDVVARQFEELENKCLLITQINGQDIRFSRILRKIDNDIGSFLVNQESA